jgi:hypothetical protein
MPSNYGIVASSFEILALPTFISLYGKIETIYLPPPGIVNTSSADTNASPNFLISVNYEFEDPDYDQSVTLEATLIDGGGNPIQGQSVYFMLFPLYGGSPIQIGQSSLSEDAPSSSTMITDSDGKISKTFTSQEWFDNDYSGYNILAAFDGNLEGTLASSSSPYGRASFEAA